MQRSDLVFGALRGFSSIVSDKFLGAQRPLDPSDSYVEFRPYARSFEKWEEEVLEVYNQSNDGDYGSSKTRIRGERVVEIRTYKKKTSDNVYHTLVAEVSTGSKNAPEPPVYLRLELTTEGFPIVVKLASWPQTASLLVEQTCFTYPQPALLDLITLAPIVFKVINARCAYKDAYFFLVDAVVRTLQELFYHTCPKREPIYLDPTFVMLDSDPYAKQRGRCFVIPFRSKLLDEIQPMFIHRRRLVGLKSPPRPVQRKDEKRLSQQEKPLSRGITIVEPEDPDRHLSEKARGKRRATR